MSKKHNEEFGKDSKHLSLKCSLKDNFGMLWHQEDNCIEDMPQYILRLLD